MQFHAGRFVGGPLDGQEVILDEDAGLHSSYAEKDPALVALYRRVLVQVGESVQVWYAIDSMTEDQVREFARSAGRI
ncbi:MAG TPA: hypothetical protein VJN44_21790 [Roseateles sp.]|nr:hypothetical protein [Roseateles sp.]